MRKCTRLSPSLLFTAVQGKSGNKVTKYSNGHYRLVYLMLLL